MCWKEKFERNLLMENIAKLQKNIGKECDFNE